MTVSIDQEKNRMMILDELLLKPFSVNNMAFTVLERFISIIWNFENQIQLYN